MRGETSEWPAEAKSHHSFTLLGGGPEVVTLASLLNEVPRAALPAFHGDGSSGEGVLSPEKSARWKVGSWVRSRLASRQIFYDTSAILPALASIPRANTLPQSSRIN